MSGPSVAEMMRKKHKRSWAGGDDYSCDYCDQAGSAWPCDALLALDALDAAERERDIAQKNEAFLDDANTKLGDQLIDAWAERDAARAEAERLREAAQPFAVNPSLYAISGNGCRLCSGFWEPPDSSTHFQHTDDCPIQVLRAALESRDA